MPGPAVADAAITERQRSHRADAEPHAFSPRQFENAANARAHASSTGPEILLQLEAFGLCAQGEGKDFVKNGNLDLAGSLPTNTHGGHGGEAYIHGMNFITESVRQVRGAAVNQAKKADNVLVSSGTAGAILSRV